MIRDQIDYQKIKTAFYNELRLASVGNPSSVSFIKHSLPEQPLVTKGIFQGIVIGGTNYVDSTRRILKNGKRRTITLKYGTLPIFKDKQTFVDFLTHHLNPKADAVGINFGFPLKPLKGPFGEIDAQLLRGTKEHTFVGLTVKIGDIVREIYKTHYHKIIPATVANDSVCLTLSGDGTENGSLIVGTGSNMCLKMTNRNKTEIVNLEAGNFDKFPLSPILRKLDKQSKLPGTQLLEKTVSGQYLAHVFNETAKHKGLSLQPLPTTRELSELAEKRSKKPETLLARDVLTNSAFLLAAVIAGAYEFMGSPKQFTMIAEGSVFWKAWHYQVNLQHQLHELGIPKGTIKFKHIRDSSIIGAIGLLTK
jgi:hexokinase